MLNTDNTDLLREGVTLLSAVVWYPRGSCRIAFLSHVFANEWVALLGISLFPPLPGFTALI